MKERTLKEYREFAHKERFEGRNEVSLDTFFEVLSIAENLQLKLRDQQEQKDIDKKVNKLRNQVDILIEQLDISQRLHDKEFKDVERYKKVLLVLLSLTTESEQDILTDILTDTLLGYELMEQYEDKVEEGKEIVKEIKEGM